MKIHNLEQQTEEWFELKITFPFSASKAQAIASAGKGLETLVFESITRKFSSGVEERYTNSDLERGNELEGQARAIYGLENDVEVVEVGFITNNKISDLAGVSPDGLVNEDGMTEIKSLSDKVYMKKLMEIAATGEFKIDSAHVWQMQMQMLFSERDWNDYVLYNPNFKRSILKKRIEADPVMQQKILTGLKIAEGLYKEKEEIIKKVLNEK